MEGHKIGYSICVEGRIIVEYILNRAIRRLWWNRKIYGFILIELVAGLVIIASQINVTIGIRQRLNDYEGQFNEKGIAINAYVGDESNLTELALPMDKADIDYIKGKYEKQVEVSYISYGSVYFNGIDSVSLVGMSQAALHNLSGIEGTEEGNVVYMGSEAMAHLGKDVIDIGEGEVVISTEKIQVNGEEYIVKPIDKEYSHTIVSFASLAQEDWAISDCIIIPISLQPIFEKHNIFYNSMMELIPTDKTEEGDTVGIVNDILEYLSQKHKDYSYEAVDKIQEYKSNSQDLSSTMELLSWVAEVFLLLIVVGMIGVLLILLDKREKDIIISVWVGADRWKLHLELLLEMLILCFTAGGISLLFAWVISPHLSCSQYSVGMCSQAVGVILVICFLISVITCSIVQLCSKKVRV